MFQKYIIFLTAFVVIKVSLSQYLNQPTTNDKSTACEGTRDAALVEHFFNLIFAEFHNTPPLCTCVQMCTDQPVYCYPSGCMPKMTKKPIRSHIQKEDKKVTLVIKDRNTATFSNFFEDYQHINTGLRENGAVNNYLPSIIRDGYKTLVQYKKTPKVELKYNFRQHINTINSVMSSIGKTVVSRARLPNRRNAISKSEKLTAKVNVAKLPSSVYATGFTDSPTIIKFINKKMKRENSDNKSSEDRHP